jgi:hypothetical protein
MKYIISKQLFESRDLLKPKLMRLIEGWVMGNEESLRFTESDADELIRLIENNPFIREESLRQLDSKRVKTLWRGLHQDWEPDSDNYTIHDRIASFSSDRDVAASFGEHTLLSIPIEKVRPNILLSIEWAAGWLGLAKVSPEQAKAEEDGEWSDDPDVSFRYMAWSQKEYLVKLPLPAETKSTNIHRSQSMETLHTKDGTKIIITRIGPSPEFGAKDRLGPDPIVVTNVTVKNPRFGQDSKEPMNLPMRSDFPEGTSNEEILRYWEDRLAGSSNYL